MAEYGVTLNGFARRPFDDIIRSMREDFQELFGPDADTTATSVLGQFAGIFADKVDELWAVAESDYAARNPDSAVGDAQDNLCSLTGVLREPALPSVATGVLCTGDEGTALDALRVISSPGTGARFVSGAAATLTIAQSWAGDTSYVYGDVRTNDGNIYIVVTDAGISAPSGGPTGEGASIVDGGVVWRFVGDGIGYAVVDFESEEKGPISATAFSLTRIETPVSGWLGVANPMDAEPGRVVETAERMRLRREKTLRAPGSAALDSIVGRVRNLPGVLEAFAFENVSIQTSPDGLPGKSFEVVVDGGDDQEIARAIFESKPIGIESYGTTTVYVDDSQGTSYPIKFSRPERLDMYVDLTVKANLPSFPVGGVEVVKLAIVEKGNALGIGDDVIVLPLRAAPLAVPGVVDVYSFEVDSVSPPINTDNLPISNRQRAMFDTSRVTVAVVP